MKVGADTVGATLVDRVARDASLEDLYSSALKAKGGAWDAANLDRFLESPMKYAPGTRMAFAGVIDASDRKALILYLEAQSK